MHSLMEGRLAIIAGLVVIVIASSILPASSSSVSTLSSASPATGRWSLPSAKLASNRRRNNKSTSSIGINDDDGNSGSCIGSGSCDKSYVLDEDDFGYDYSDYDDSDDDKSIYSNCNSLRFRGGAAAASSSRANLPGLHTGWRKQNKQSNNKGRSKIRQMMQSQQQQIQQEFENLQQQKLRQFRKLFRQKQRQFQNTLYNLNSRLDDTFPKPPYSLWRMDTDTPIGKTTLTGKIFLLNIAVFGLQTMYPQITAMGAKRSDLLLNGQQMYRLLTPIFLHGGIGHLFANSYSLKSMGINVENAFGECRLLATYLVSGVTGNILSAIQSPNPAVGASGAIFGLVGAQYTFLSRNQDLFGDMGQRQKGALVQTIGMNLLLGMTNPMIDNWGHIGGFIGGVGMAYLIGPKLYVARVPLSQDNLGSGGFGAGKVVIDRPMLTFRTPEFVDEGIYRVNENARKLGRRINASVGGLFNNKGEQEYFLDKNVDISMGSINSGNGDGTIYRTLKDSIELDGDINSTPSDGLRQDVAQLDPPVARQQQSRQRRRSVPKAGMSVRPKYGHLYR